MSNKSGCLRLVVSVIDVHRAVRARISLDFALSEFFFFISEGRWRALGCCDPAAKEVGGVLGTLFMMSEFVKRLKNFVIETAMTGASLALALQRLRV
jgi:hypothetical protein